MKAFQWFMALFSRVFPGRASRVGLSLLTTPRVQAPPVSGWPAADDYQEVGERAGLHIWSGGPVRVLLVHGWSGHIRQFLPLMKGLGRERYTFYALQMPGHGERAEGQSHVGEFVAAIRDAIQWIGQPLDLAVGHSMGAGALAVVLSESNSVHRTVLLAPPAGFRSLVARLADFLHFGERARQQLLERMAQRVGLSFEQLDVARRSRDIRAPVLLVHDVGDREIPFSDSLRLHQALPASTLFQVQGSGHKRVLSDPTVLARIEAFMAERDEGESAENRGAFRVPA
ncbi:MAG: alpha/beta fold hydrolase [Pseudomonadota bacterium]|nr:alpha/beta fold hydrolase [Pseudomonadota bacterium]